MSLGTKFVEKIFSNTGNMVSKKDASKDTVERNNGDVVEHVSMKLLVYADTQLFIEKDMDITWQ